MIINGTHTHTLLSHGHPAAPFLGDKRWRIVEGETTTVPGLLTPPLSRANEDEFCMMQQHLGKKKGKKGRSGLGDEGGKGWKRANFAGGKKVVLAKDRGCAVVL